MTRRYNHGTWNISDAPLPIHEIAANNRMSLFDGVGRDGTLDRGFTQILITLQFEGCRANVTLRKINY
jgi:hypothetical protein